MLYPIEPTVQNSLDNKKRTATTGFHKDEALTILGAKKLNGCVRDGNRWVLLAIVTVLILFSEKNTFILSKLNS